MPHSFLTIHIMNFTTFCFGLQAPAGNFFRKITPRLPSAELGAPRYIFAGAETPSRARPLASTRRTLSASLSRTDCKAASSPFRRQAL